MERAARDVAIALGEARAAVAEELLHRRHLVRAANVALVNAKDPLSKVVTLSVEKPSFPVEELKGAILIGG